MDGHGRRTELPETGIFIQCGGGGIDLAGGPQ